MVKIYLNHAEKQVMTFKKTAVITYLNYSGIVLIALFIVGLSSLESSMGKY